MVSARDMHVRSFLLPFALLMLGAALGYAAGAGASGRSQEEILQLLREQDSHRRAAMEGPPRLPGGNCVFSVPASAVDTPALRAEIAKVVREELQLQRGSGPQVAPAAPPKEPEPTPENDEAKDRATRMVEKAVSTRHWTRDDAMAYRDLLARMTDAQRKEMSQRLIVTLNGGGISVETMGPPF